jgi:hypothetical protein
MFNCSVSPKCAGVAWQTSLELSTQVPPPAMSPGILRQHMPSVPLAVVVSARRRPQSLSLGPQADQAEAQDSMSQEPLRLRLPLGPGRCATAKRQCRRGDTGARFCRRVVPHWQAGPACGRSITVQQVAASCAPAPAAALPLAVTLPQRLPVPVALPWAARYGQIAAHWQCQQCGTVCAEFVTGSRHCQWHRCQ